MRLFSANLGVLLALCFLVPVARPALGQERAAQTEELFLQISSQLEEYRLANGEYPRHVPKDFLWDGSNLLDPWGRPFYYYRIPPMVGGGFVLVSYGADGKAGGMGVGEDVVVVHMGSLP